MNLWIIKDKIKRNLVTFKKGDIVVLFRRKTNGYPRGVIFGVDYLVKSVNGDNLIIEVAKKEENLYHNDFSINKTYFIQKDTLRDIKINQILK